MALDDPRIVVGPQEILDAMVEVLDVFESLDTEELFLEGLLTSFLKDREIKNSPIPIHYCEAP